MRLFNALLLLVFGAVLFSCSKTDDIVKAPVAPYAYQYPRESASIEKFLDEYTMTDSDDFQKVEFAKLPAPIDASQSIRIKYAAKLKFKMVNSNGVDYKVYYIQLREGVGENPMKVDSIFGKYRGLLLNEKYGYDSTKTFNENQTFDQVYASPIWIGYSSEASAATLMNLIQGFKEIFPLFKSGNHSVDPLTNQVTYSDFGAGVMFLPSGLAYYNSNNTLIPAYSPLIFSFTLNKVNHVDNDYDGVDTMYEDIDGDGSYYDDDTDGDGIPNYLDRDDDGDGTLTKDEIRKNGVLQAYNDIEDCSGNTTDVNRKRKHIDKNCH